MQYLMCEQTVARVRPRAVLPNRMFEAFLAWLVDPLFPLRLFMIATLRMHTSCDVDEDTVRYLHETSYLGGTPKNERVPVNEALYFDGASCNES